MNAQIPQTPMISVEVTEDGWLLSRREYFSFEQHPELMTRLVRETRSMAPSVVAAYLEKLWDERAAATVGRIVERARRSGQNGTPG